MPNEILNNNIDKKNGSIITVTKLVTSIIICQLVGLVGAFFTMPAIEGWYSALRKPFFTPPAWVFAPVWVVLFLLMGVSFFLVWRKGANGEARVIFITQLTLNVLWTAFFFGLKSPGLAFIELILFWFAIVCNILTFYKISKTAALLLLPYLLWVTFAGVLNFTIWMLNEGVTFADILKSIL